MSSLSMTATGGNEEKAAASFRSGREKEGARSWCFVPVVGMELEGC